jgi:predicted DNA-binding protein with PD1-like motif
MAIYREVESDRVFMGKLRFGGDLLEELTAVCRERDIKLGRVEALGAVKTARVAFYNQATREYEFLDIDKQLEITKLVGNISLRDGSPMVHAHVTLSDSAGNAYGGHLVAGTIVFACEFVIESFDGPEYRRGDDEDTGLPLWDM